MLENCLKTYDPPLFLMIFFTGQPRFHETNKKKEGEKKSREIPSANLLVFYVNGIMCFTRECRGQLTCKLRLRGTSCTV